MSKPPAKLTSNHWGIGLVDVQDGRISNVAPHPSDPAPSPLNGNIPGALNGAARILRPAVREGWLRGRTGGHTGTGTGTRGQDSFIEVSWDRALDLLAAELTRVKTTHGNSAIYAGSYGWSSAGRFHHAQSQLKRFLNTLGGFTRSEGNYSYNAALATMPHILGGGFRTHLEQATRWNVIAAHSDLVVAFGGLAMRNMTLSDGGLARHRVPGHLADCAANGVRFVCLSPLRRDIDAGLGAQWLPPRPGSDTAVMMGLAHTLLEENLHDTAFLARYCTGFDSIESYLRGETDGEAKTAQWAAEISGIPADRIRSLARDMAASRTMITCAAALQRADHGEQPLWMATTLAAMLGQIGLPGGGVTIGMGVNGNVGAMARPFRWGALPQGRNPVEGFIPVAMLSEMLLHPGSQHPYQGQTLTLPDIALVWWAGGNPFHHHQDLNRLTRAFQTPETVVVNDISWTSTARHADIVLPVAATLERNDFGAGHSDNILVPMPKITEPPGEARTEFEIYTALAARLGTEAAFTEGLDEDGWLRRLWSETQEAAKAAGSALPEWEDFISGDIAELPDPAPHQVFLADFREDPEANPRPTTSGLIELTSKTVAAMGHADCPGHPIWAETRDRSAGHAARYPLALLSGQPGTRLHSQMDNGALSMAAKIAGREPVLIHPKDAATRGISSGDVVELFNDRGRCLAGAEVTEDVMQGAVFLWTGAWYDPDPAAPQNRDRHGNPNTLTHDARSSSFSQSPASHSALIEIRKFTGPVPDVTVHSPPNFTVE
ncbi:molybdopterin-dependent oxidoreductase [Alphaproteobacteria bacterium KMM 3653]|uniref:Molybdopterin-dependent oxidoreductase n=1 Tax=Harenicola maris TaxID=2841044 RepID=A0AAP2CM96_9RHOB|nr:molybdopterin-dependent oxidoreductase [Harenicola maris]